MSFADVSEAEAFLARHPEVRSIEAFLIDANGVPRGKLLHRDELLAAYKHGRPLPASILSLSIRGEDVPETGLVWDVGDADCTTFPLAGSLTLQTWRDQPTGQVQLSLHPDGGPSAVADPRRLLQRVLGQLAADGLYPVMAVELEFYLLDFARDPSGRPQPARLSDGSRPDAPQVYGVLEVERLQPFFDDLYRACEAQGLPLRTAISEYAPGQFELTLEHRADALQAIDEGVRYKRVVKGVAARHGCQACFMAKPFADRAGSGLHLHVSLADRAGNNLYASEDPAGTPLLRHSGMSSTASAAPTRTPISPPPRCWQGCTAASADRSIRAIRSRATATPRTARACPPTGSPPCARWSLQRGRAKPSARRSSRSTSPSSMPSWASS